MISANLIIGLRHLDELRDALFAWAGDTPPISAELQQIPADALPHWVVTTSAAAEPLSFELYLPMAYSRLLDEISVAGIAPVVIRSALLWIGLSHPDELADALSELRAAEESSGIGQTVMAFYLGELHETDRTADEFAAALDELRRGDDPAKVAARAGVPLDVLLAVSGEFRDDSTGGQLALTG